MTQRSPPRRRTDRHIHSSSSLLVPTRRRRRLVLLAATTAAAFAFALLVPPVLADVRFTSPGPGDEVAAGAPIRVEWEDGFGETALADLTDYQLFLAAGGDTEDTSVLLPNVAPVSGSHRKGFSTTIQLDDADDGPAGENAYFLKIVSSSYAPDGDVSNNRTVKVTNYSPRFTITGATGSWPSKEIEDGYHAAKMSHFNVPRAQPPAAAAPAAPPPPAGVAAPAGAPPPAAAAPPPAADPAEATLSYQFQTTGNVRYAPMQAQPPSKITKTATNRVYPSSGFDAAVSRLATPSIVTTQTASLTASYNTRENTAAPAAMPSPADDMAKFLARWKD